MTNPKPALNLGATSGTWSYDNGLKFKSGSSGTLFRLFMDTTWNCPKNTRAQDIANWILTAYGRTPNKKLHNVVLNFHGPGEDNVLEDSSAVIIGEVKPESGFGTSRYKEATYSTLN